MSAPPPTRLRAPRRTVAALAMAVLVAGCGSTDPVASPAPSPAADAERPIVIVHRTPTCDCCGGYEEALAAHGFDVVQEMHDDVVPIKDAFGVPDSQWSCHTNEIDGYFVEGHVPMAAIDELLEQRPDVDGISLAGMPAGTPGMPGEQEAPFVVATVVDGEVTGEFGSY